MGDHCVDFNRQRYDRKYLDLDLVDMLSQIQISFDLILYLHGTIYEPIDQSRDPVSWRSDEQSRFVDPDRYYFTTRLT